MITNCPLCKKNSIIPKPFGCCSKCYLKKEHIKVTYMPPKLGTKENPIKLKCNKCDLFCKQNNADFIYCPTHLAFRHKCIDQMYYTGSVFFGYYNQNYPQETTTYYCIDKGMLMPCVS